MDQAPLVRQLQAEIRDLVDALAGLVGATGDEPQELADEIWDRAAQLVALHDEEEEAK